MISLRPYQSAALAQIIDGMKADRYVLAQAATGAGKTIIFASLIKYFMENFQMRIAILAHREILVRQAFDKLMKVWPEGADKVGIACASVGAVDLNRPVVIGSPQTLSKRLNDIPVIHLIIIDECHRLPPKNEKSQYRALLEALEASYSGLRVLGVTATPYRLGHGYIYGNICKSKNKNWFSSMHCQMSIAELQEQGWLVQLRAKQAENIERELVKVSTASGDFNVAELSLVMSRKVHIESAVNAYKNFGEGRQHVVAFCVTIEHAEILRQAFIDAGISAAVIHSKMDKDAREKNMQDFEDGVCRVICNVGVLTEGWDCTCVDCILFCRPTMSPALYVQMVGRGLRTHPGKTDCLLLDLSGNCLRHGDINEPLVSVPGQTTKKQSMPSPVKECPNCGELFPRRLRECPSCGWMPEIPPLENAPEVEEMHEVKFSNGPFKAHVLNFSIKSHRSKAGNMFAKLSMSCNVPDLGSLPVWVCSYLDFEGEVSEYRKAKAWEAWSKITRGSEPPKTIDEAVRRASEIVMPDVIKIKRNGQYLNVVRWGE